VTLAAAAYGRSVARRESKNPPPPPELLAAWKTRDYGLPHGAGWRNEKAGYLERITHALNVFTAFKEFEGRGEMTERDFADRFFELWQIVIDVEKLERENG
jgi:hypothetical protein